MATATLTRENRTPTPTSPQALTFSTLEGIDTVTEMHPALDVVGDTLYVTVQVLGESGKPEYRILSSQGTMYTIAEWEQESALHGLLSRATPKPNGCGVRWNMPAIRAFGEVTLQAPEWKDTYEQVRTALETHLDVPADQLTVLTLYSMATYFNPLFPQFPFLHLKGPSNSGKSRMGECLARLSFNGLLRASITEASVTRTVNEGLYTLVMTECDNFASKDSGDSLIQKLQAAFTKKEAVVELTEKGTGGTFKTESYYVYSPRVFCSTVRFKAPTLNNRCILLPILRSPHPDMERLDRELEGSGAWAECRDALYRLQLLRWQDVRETKAELRASWRDVDGRNKDKWLPLATIASLVSDEVLDAVKCMATESQRDEQDDTANTFDNIPWQFARWVVRAGDVKEIDATSLYEKFLSGYETDEHKQTVPTWAKATGTAVNAEQLRKNIWNPKMLVKDLEQRRLISPVLDRDGKPKQHPRTRRALFVLSQAEIDAQVTAYLGEQEEIDREWEIPE